MNPLFATLMLDRETLNKALSRVPEGTWTAFLETLGISEMEHQHVSGNPSAFRALVRERWRSYLERNRSRWEGEDFADLIRERLAAMASGESRCLPQAMLAGAPLSAAERLERVVLEKMFKGVDPIEAFRAAIRENPEVVAEHKRGRG